MELDEPILIILLFFTFSLTSSRWARNDAIAETRSLPSHSDHHPKRYVETPRWVKRQYKINQRLIPRHIYVQLIFSWISAILCPVNILISFIVYPYYPYIVLYLYHFHMGLSLLEYIISIVFHFIMKKQS